MLRIPLERAVRVSRLPAHPLRELRVRATKPRRGSRAHELTTMLQRVGIERLGLAPPMLGERLVGEAG